MRIVFVLIFGFTVMASAETYSQTVRLDMKMSNASIKEVIDNIEENSKFIFLYKDQDLDVNKRVSVDLKSASIDQILYSVLKKENVEYEVYDRQIVIREKTRPIDSQQQTKRAVNGVVVDATGKSIPGVAVLVKGTSVGAISDFEGAFSLNVASDATTLLFSFVGMKTQEVDVAGKTQVSVIMQEDFVGMDEVVVVGYGTQKKGNVSGAISQVGAEVFEDKATPDIGTALQGVLPNLNVTIGDGSPDATADFNIRGFESINGGSPLILVDGVPYSSLSDLNPEDIASVSILKDASSAAIYGARAAFGVILVTTKMGRKATPTRVQFSSSMAFSNNLIYPDSFNSVESATAANLAANNNGQSDVYTEEHITYLQNYLNNPGTAPLWYKLDDGSYQTTGNLDVYDEAYADFAVRKNSNLSLSGGSENSSYYVSVAYLDDKGQWAVNPDVKERYNTLLKFKYDVNSWLTMGFQTGYNKSEYDQPHAYSGIGSYWHALERSNPWALITTPEGFPEGEGLLMKHTLSYQRYGGRDVKTTQETRLTGYFTIKPFKGMEVNGTYTHSNIAVQNSMNQKSFTMINDDTPGTPFYGHSATDYLIRTSSTSTKDVFDLFGSYSFDLATKNHFKVMVGYNQTSSEYLYTYAKSLDLIKQDTPGLSLSYGDQTLTDSNTFTALRGVFGRFNYNYDEKYFVEFNARYDGSDVFPEENRFGFFPSFSGAWVVSKEDFFQSVPLISNLKLRASYGSLGNQSVASDLFRPLMGTTTAVGYLIDGENPMAITASSLVSNNLTWETSTTRNFGFDVALFENKLSASADIYTRVVSDMIVAGEELPASLGTSAPQTNGADLETKGFEVEVAWKHKLENGLRYGISANLSDNQSEITKYDLNPSGLIANYYVGRKIGEIWGLETEGIFQSAEEVENAADQSPIKSRTWQAGDVRYKDLNGDGQVSKGLKTLDDPGDRKVIGNSYARYNYGVALSADYKGFDFTMFFRGVGKKDIFISNSSPAYWGHSGANNNIWSTGNKWALENSWTQDNPDAKLPIYKRNSSSYNMQVQSRFLESGAFLRLKSAVFGYTVPQFLTRQVKIDKVRVYFSGQNLWTKDNLYGLYDPETLGNMSSTTGKIYPNKRTFSFGVQIAL